MYAFCVICWCLFFFFLFNWVWKFKGAICTTHTDTYFRGYFISMTKRGRRELHLVIPKKQSHLLFLFFLFFSATGSLCDLNEINTHFCCCQAWCKTPIFWVHPLQLYLWDRETFLSLEFFSWETTNELKFDLLSRVKKSENGFLKNGQWQKDENLYGHWILREGKIEVIVRLLWFRNCLDWDTDDTRSTL